MYTEKQHFQHPYAQWLKWLCAVCVIAQLTLLVADEAGHACLPLGKAAYWGILLATGLVFWLLAQAALVLRIGAHGVSLRYFPYQLRFQHLRWKEIRQLRILPAGECPAGVRFGLPARDFTHAYWLTAPSYRILHIALVNGTQLYVSTSRPGDLLDFLQHMLHLRGMKMG